MSFATPAIVASATPYPVLLVGDQAPSSTSGFAESDRFTLDLAGTPYLVRGCGRVVGDQVRFHEKDVANSGKDIRVWSVTRHDDGTFTAQHEAAF
jgi:hypothetical protein